MKRFKIIGLCLVAVFALSAAMASGASAHLYGTCSLGTPEVKPPCKAGETFTPFSETGEMVVSHGTTPFLLLSVATPVKGIECKTLSDMGILRNLLKGTEEIAESEDSLVFQSCTPINLSGCTQVNLRSNHEILGNVTDLVSSNGKKVTVTVPASQFNVKCLIAGEETELGDVTGSAEGTVTGNELEFSKAKGLEFFHLPSTITGTNLTDTLGGKPVLIH